jgi:hypothetical protein
MHLAVPGGLEVNFMLVDHAGFLPGTKHSGEVLSNGQKGEKSSIPAKAGFPILRDKIDP